MVSVLDDLEEIAKIDASAGIKDSDEKLKATKTDSQLCVPFEIAAPPSKELIEYQKRLANLSLS